MYSFSACRCRWQRHFSVTFSFFSLIHSLFTTFNTIPFHSIDRNCDRETYSLPITHRDTRFIHNKMGATKPSERIQQIHLLFIHQMVRKGEHTIVVHWPCRVFIMIGVGGVGLVFTSTGAAFSSLSGSLVFISYFSWHQIHTHTHTYNQAR